MSAIVEFLFPAPARRSAAGIFRWWEARRLRYNAVVGATGLASMGLVAGFGTLPPGPRELPPFLVIAVVYGVMANVCYCTGPLAELLLEKLWGRKVLPTGPALFRMGLTFSVGLTLFPAMIAGLDWMARLVFTLL